MSKGLVEFLWVALPKVLGGVSTVGINVILLRYFRPEDFGVYSLCVAGILLTDSVLGAAIDLGVLRLATFYRATDPARSIAVEKAAILLKLAGVAGLSLFLGLLLFSGRLLPQASNELFYVSSFAALSMLLLRSSLTHLQIERRFALYGCLDLLSSVLKFGGIALLLAIHQQSPVTVLLLLALGPAAAFLLGLGALSNQMLGRWSHPPGLIVEMLGFVKWSLLTFGLAALISRVDVFLVSQWSNLREVGIFSGGQAFAAIPELIGTYLAIVMGPRIMPYCRQGRFFELFRTFQVSSIASCLLIYLLAATSMKHISPYLLPASFARSSEVILALLPGALAGLATFPLTLSFLMFVRPKFLFTLDCLAAPIVIPLYYYAISGYGALGAAYVSSASRVIKATIAQAIAWKLASSEPEVLGLGAAEPGIPLTPVLETGRIS